MRDSEKCHWQVRELGKSDVHRAVVTSVIDVEVREFGTCDNEGSSPAPLRNLLRVEGRQGTVSSGQ